MTGRRETGGSSFLQGSRASVAVEMALQVARCRNSQGNDAFPKQAFAAARPDDVKARGLQQ
jgi:hypothetical protein